MKTAYILRHGQTDFNLKGIVQGSGVDETVADFIDAGIPWEKHPEINEMSWGDHEGKKGTPESIAEYQEIKDGWGHGRIDGRIGGGESAREMGTRLQKFIDHLPERKEDLLLICSHGRAMCGLVTLMMGKPIDQMNELTHNNTGLWRATLQEDGTWLFDLKNDRTHLPEEFINAGKW